jgi:hypothetical protein
MTSAERKTRWRELNPERRREHERRRAARRREEGRAALGQRIVGSYQRYELNLAPDGQPWSLEQEIARYRRGVGRFRERERSYVKRLQRQIEEGEAKLARWGLTTESTIEDIMRSVGLTSAA